MVAGRSSLRHIRDETRQQDANFITADFLYMFRASCAHHQEYKILTGQPPVQVVMVAGGSSLRHIRDETTIIHGNTKLIFKKKLLHSEQILNDEAKLSV